MASLEIPSAAYIEMFAKVSHDFFRFSPISKVLTLSTRPWLVRSGYNLYVTRKVLSSWSFYAESEICMLLTVALLAALNVLATWDKSWENSMHLFVILKVNFQFMYVYQPYG